MSNINWFNTYPRPNISSNLNGIVVLNKGVTTPSKLADSLTGFQWEGFWGLPGAQDAINGISVYPINLQRNMIEGGQPGYLKALKTSYSPDVVGAQSDPIQVRTFDARAYSAGMHISQFYVNPIQDFYDVEPYRKLDLYLPYYGIVNVPLTKASGYNVNIILHVDFFTGKAVYSIATSVIDIKSAIGTQYPFMYNKSLTFVEILSTHEFQLGYYYPLSRVGYSDFVRDVSVGAISTALSVASSATFVPASLIQKESSTVVKERNPATGRMIKVYEETSTSKPANPADVKNYQNSRIMNTAAMSISSLGNVSMRGSTSSINNQLISIFGPQSVHVIETKAKMSMPLGTFEHLYGRPLGEGRRLGDMSGYVDISAIKLEDYGTTGVGFDQATEDEIDELQAILLSGVYLP